MKETRVLYDTFNAKYLSHSDVAETFVSNSDFFEIAKNSHTVVLGPRGCGKTTMFKMLTTPALKNWNPKTKDEILLREGMPFIAIYIPSDELWKNQLDGFSASLGDTPELSKVISNALITTNILSNYCKSIKEHIEFSFEKDSKKEFEFAKNLIQEWALPDAANSLASIRQALESRKNNLIAQINKAIYLKNSKLGLDIKEYYFLDFIKSIHVACIAFERIYNNGNELKWALCFDELELVSKEFFEELISKLRIAPANILFKLSAGPLVDFSHSLAQLSHDFNLVKMWPFDYEQENKYLAFCEEIAIENIKRKRELSHFTRYADIDLFSIFGELDYNSYALKQYNFRVNINSKETEPESLTWFAFKKLAEYDFTFAKILDKNGINSENPIPRTQKNYDSIVRKLKEIVINRLVFKRFNEGNKGQRLSNRPRKVFPIYYGKTTILRICDGNPRFMIGLLSDMFSSLMQGEDIAQVKIPPIDQAKMIREISDRFLSMIQTYPTSQKIGENFIDLVGLIKIVGNYFSKDINEAPLKLTPTNCFYITKDLSNELLELVKVGVNLGAFIKIDQRANLAQNEEKHIRYRLSYLLAPQFKMPLRLYGAINLNKLISFGYRNSDDELNFDLGYED